MLKLCLIRLSSNSPLDLRQLYWRALRRSMFRDISARRQKTFRLLLRVSTIFAFFGSVFSVGFLETLYAATIAPQAISQDTVWTVEESPYVVSSRGMTVDHDVTLTIEPGVIVKLQSNGFLNPGGIHVFGALSVGSSDGDPVIITSYKDDSAGGDTNGDADATTPAAGDWVHALSFETGSSGTFDNVVVRYGGLDNCVYGCRYEGMIDSAGTVSIRHSTFTNAQYAPVRQIDGTLEVTDSTLSTSTYGFVQLGGTAEFSGNTIQHMESQGVRITAGTSRIVENDIQGGIDGIFATGGEVVFGKNSFSGTSRAAVILSSASFTDEGDNTSISGVSGILLTGSLATSTQLYPLSLPYRFDGLVVPLGVSLSIKPGTVIKMGDSYGGGVHIFGTLSMGEIGSDPVIVTSLHDDVGGDTNANGSTTVPAAQDWRKPFTFESGSQGDIRNAIFRYGGLDQCIYGCVRYAMVENGNGVLSIHRSTFTHATIAIAAGGLGTTTIEDSDISDVNFGVYGNTGSGVSIRHSNIQGNHAIENLGVENVDAADNWWGDASGPRQTTNLAGIGSFATEHVLYEPWSLEPFDAGAGTGEALSDEAATTSCAADCFSSVMFLPGLEASRLYVDSLEDDEGEAQLWEPKTLLSSLIPQLYLDENGKSLRDDIYTRDVIDEGIVPIAGPNIYKSFIRMMDGLKEEGAITDWEAIPYDWRLSIDDILSSGVKTVFGISYLQATSTPYIVQELERLAAGSKSGKVTIVAHSNGGLLAKALMMRLEEMGLENLVDKMVLVAVPQVGTPQAAGALLHGFDQGMPTDGVDFIMSPKVARELGRNMSGAYGLLPSDLYFTLVSDPIATFPATSTLPELSAATRQFGAAIFGRDSFFDFLRGAEGRNAAVYADIMSPQVLNAGLLAYAKNLHDRLDAWTPPSSVHVIQIAGWGVDTVKGIRYFQGVRKGKPVIQYDVLTTEDGDNTVVVPSALAIATSTANVERYWLDLQLVGSGFFRRTPQHKNILEIPELENGIKQIIKNRSILDGEDFSTSTPPSTNPIKKLKFSLISPVYAFDMFDDEGNHTGISTSTGQIEENIPGTSYRQFGDVKYISVPIDTIVLINQSSPPHQGRSSSVHITVSNPSTSEQILEEEMNDPDNVGSYTVVVQESIGDVVASSTAYVDIPATEEFVATLDIPESIEDLPNLETDQNADGVTDITVEPGEIYAEPTPIEESVEVAPIVSINEPERHSSRGSQHRSVPAIKNIVTKPINKTVETVVPKIVVESVEKPLVSRVEQTPIVHEASVQTASVFNAADDLVGRSIFRKFTATIKSWFHIVANLFKR